jgi:hypothetical protein
MDEAGALQRKGLELDRPILDGWNDSEEES